MKKLILIIAFLLGGFIAFCQPGGDEDVTDVDVPLDGLVGLLAISGVIYMGKKAYNHYKKH